MHIINVPTTHEPVLRDLAILSKLNTAIAACNANMEEYNFGTVTTALHSFFLYDVSIEQLLL